MQPSVSGRQMTFSCESTTICRQNRSTLLNICSNRGSGVIACSAVPLRCSSLYGKRRLHRVPVQATRKIGNLKVRALTGEVADVEELQGLRVVLNGNRPIAQYLVKWKDGKPSTWEPASNVADNLLRDYEEQWWKCCKENDVETMKRMLRGGASVLSKAVDEDRRTGLHYAAGLGHLEASQLLVRAGSNVNALEREGYTPLHIAVGYSHFPVVQLLLEAGADPAIPDRSGRDVVQLIDHIRSTMPVPTPELMARMMALEQVSNFLTGQLFDEMEPLEILKVRANENGSRDFLVRWPDGHEDSWVSQGDVSQEVIDDWDAGLEYGELDCILKYKVRGDGKEYLVRWKDDYGESWEPEENIASDVLAAFHAEMAAKRKGPAEEDLRYQKPAGSRPAQRQKELAPV
eukprot:jgi/Botrbrau1/20774/Bobra.0156s0006.1